MRVLSLLRDAWVPDVVVSLRRPGHQLAHVSAQAPRPSSLPPQAPKSSLCANPWTWETLQLAASKKGGLCFCA